MTNHPFIPIIVGTDMNAYNMAISFHEQYGIKPILVGKEPLILYDFKQHHRNNRADTLICRTNKYFVSFLKEIAEKYAESGKKMLLIGTNDLYVRMIIENAEELKSHYVFNYISETLMNNLLVKSNFYKFVQSTALIRQRHIITLAETISRLRTRSCSLSSSSRVTASCTIRIHFRVCKKYIRLIRMRKFRSVIETIKASGYQEELIIQDFIPGDDTYMWDSVFYMNSKGKAELITFAQVVLQEHTVTAIGNYTALITRYNEEMMMKLKGFLEALNYVGYANFDLKYDERDGKFKVFEVNIRQGRSSYYITACGHNMAKYFVDDLIYGQQKPLTLLDEKFLFTVVPENRVKESSSRTQKFSGM